jgi:methionyl-tRNA synthetase
LADRFVLGNCKKCGSATRGDQCESCSTIFNNPAEEITALSCSVCGNAPSPRQTTHFYLKLAAQSGVLKEWLLGEGGMDGWSNNAKGVTRSWLNSPAEDRCITRDLKWGVPVPHPGYEKKVFYVWFEAPIGYISMAAAILP